MLIQNSQLDVKSTCENMPTWMHCGAVQSNGLKTTLTSSFPPQMLTYWSVKCGLLWLISLILMFLPICLLSSSTNPCSTRKPREPPDERSEHTRKHDVPTSSVTGNDLDDYVERHRKFADRHMINTLQILSAVIPALIRDLVPWLNLLDAIS